MLRHERLVEELLKRKDVEPPRTPPRPQYYSISSPQLRTTPGGTQIPPGNPPPEPMDFSELPPWGFDPFATDDGHMGGGTGLEGLEDFWTPAGQQQGLAGGVQQQHQWGQPEVDRFAWLDCEVKRLRGDGPPLVSDYWGLPVQRDGRPAASFACKFHNHHQCLLMDKNKGWELHSPA